MQIRVSLLHNESGVKSRLVLCDVIIFIVAIIVILRGFLLINTNDR